VLKIWMIWQKWKKNIQEVITITGRRFRANIKVNLFCTCQKWTKEFNCSFKHQEEDQVFEGSQSIGHFACRLSFHPGIC
jgi:hypothetical protein